MINSFVWRARPKVRNERGQMDRGAETETETERGREEEREV